jgi:lysophospholipid hydrolase
LSVLSGEPAMFSIIAKEDTEIAIISKDNFHRILAIQPTVTLAVAWLIVQRMSPFVRQIDFALEWNLVEAGNALFRQDNKAENIFIVLNGRLRSILKNEGKKQLVGEVDKL